MEIALTRIPFSEELNFHLIYVVLKVYYYHRFQTTLRLARTTIKKKIS